ncbi:MAG: hypothetical protein ACJART_001722, partial [Maribacter sp.]
KNKAIPIHRISLPLGRGRFFKEPTVSTISKQASPPGRGLTGGIWVKKIRDSLKTHVSL